MTLCDIEYLLNTLSHYPSIMIAHNDIDRWTSTVVDELVLCGLLQVAEPAKHLACPGCEQQCYMPVNLLPSVNGRQASPFISCDKREEIGLVKLDRDCLQQWRSSCEQLASVIARLLGINTEQLYYQAQHQRWYIGVMKSKQCSRPLFLTVLDEAVTLLLAGHQIPVMDCLTISNGKLAIKQQKLITLLNKPMGTDKSNEQTQ